MKFASFSFTVSESVALAVSNVGRKDLRFASEQIL